VFKSGLFEGDQQYDGGCDDKRQQEKQPLGAQPAHELRFILVALRVAQLIYCAFQPVFDAHGFSSLCGPQYDYIINRKALAGRWDAAPGLQRAI